MLKKLIDGGERSWGVVGVFAVAILAGMWIETSFAIPSLVTRTLLPSWLGCGLKPISSTLYLFTLPVAILAGMWIETGNGCLLSVVMPVAILAGMWIETCLYG